MGSEKEIEKVYDLIEKYNFDELSETNKAFVLSEVSIEEYIAMRTTIFDTEELFATDLTEEEKPMLRKVKQVFMFPVEIYKVAVFLLFMFGITFLLVRSNPADKNMLLAQADTVYLEKIDTVVLKVIDTVEVITERVIVKEMQSDHMQQAFAHDNTHQKEGGYVNCEIDMCPDDMAQLTKKTTKGSLSNDNSTKDFLMLLQ